MKKAFLRLFSIVIMLAMVIPTFSIAEASTADNKNAVYNFLTDEIGFNSAAACGIMANIEHESNFNPKTVIRDSNGLLSGGLCMWNGSRFRKLQNYCSSKGLGSLTVSGQLNYLKNELKQSSFKHIYTKLKSVPNTAKGAYDAAYYWCYYYEIPGNRGTKSVQRGNLAKNSYWSKYGNKKSAAASEPALKLTSAQAGKTLDIGSAATLKLSGGSKSAKAYRVYLKNDGKNSVIKSVKLGLDQKTCKLSLKDVKNGVYTVSAVALNKNGDRLGKESNKVKITVKCLSHAYSSKITKQPTQTKAGVKTLVCSECGAKKQEAIPSLSSTSFKNTAVSSLKVTSAAKDRAVIKWSKVKNANGYAVYQTIGGKWKMIKTLDGKTTSYTVKDLKPGQTYKLRVRAFIKSGDAKVYSKAKDITAATKPAEPKFTKVSRPAKGAVTLTWSKAAGADSYIIYTSPTAKGDYKKLATVDGGKTSVKLTGLKRSRYAYFKIKAVNKASNTAYSSAERTAYAFVL